MKGEGEPGPFVLIRGQRRSGGEDFVCRFVKVSNKTTLVVTLYLSIFLEDEGGANVGQEPSVLFHASLRFSTVNPWFPEII